MTGGSVRFTLDDGATLEVPDADLRGIYDLLWELAKEPGAISTAALLMDAWRLGSFTRRPIELTTPQSSVIREAVARLGEPRP